MGVSLEVADVHFVVCGACHEVASCCRKRIMPASSSALGRRVWLPGQESNRGSAASASASESAKQAIPSYPLPRGDEHSGILPADVHLKVHRRYKDAKQYRYFSIRGEPSRRASARGASHSGVPFVLVPIVAILPSVALNALFMNTELN